VRLIFFIVLFAILGAIVIFNKNDAKDQQITQPAPERNQTLIQSLHNHRQDLAHQISTAHNATEKEQLLRNAHFLFNNSLPHLMDCWIGTAYDFNGMSETPGKGNIACGYFVTTVLRDSGIALERLRLAQAPSETLIRTIIEPQDIRTSSNQDYQNFLSDLDQMGHGIYIIGLDTHVGFIVNTPERWSFIHASQSDPNAVTDQDQASARAIRQSQYRVVGKLAANDQFILRWLGLE